MTIINSIVLEIIRTGYTLSNIKVLSRMFCVKVIKKEESVVLISMVLKLYRIIAANIRMTFLMQRNQI